MSRQDGNKTNVPLFLLYAGVAVFLALMIPSLRQSSAEVTCQITATAGGHSGQLPIQEKGDLPIVVNTFGTTIARAELVAIDRNGQEHHHRLQFVWRPGQYSQSETRNLERVFYNQQEKVRLLWDNITAIKKAGMQPQQLVLYLYPVKILGDTIDTSQVSIHRYQLVEKVTKG